MPKYDSLENRVDTLESGASGLDPEKAHKFRVEYVIIGGGFFLIAACLLGSFIIAVRSDMPEYIKAFLNLSQSAAMLVLGYLFGTRNNS